MTLNVLFAARPERWETYETPLKTAFADMGIDADLSCTHAPGDVDYIVYAPNGPLQDFSNFTRAKAVLNLWAGVEDIVDNPTLHIPLARMVDFGLRQGMTEWVVAHVLRHHLGTDLNVLHQDGIWRDQTPPLATDRPVTILGLGELGTACATALAGLGFPVTGWSRSAKDVPGIRCLHGQSGFDQALTDAQIVVLLLPSTHSTQNAINARSMALLHKGAVIINPGRGPLIDDDALIRALDSGQVSHATLDVFRVEPLPPAHPFWAHPKVTVTPHIASETRPETASRIIAENIRRGEDGKPFLYLVDRSLGY